MQRTKTRMGLLLAVVSLGSALALAQGPPPGMPPGGPGHPGGPMGGPDPILGPVGRILHDLDLSADQRQAVHERIRTRVDGGLADLVHDLSQARRQLDMTLWDAASTDADLQAATDLVAERSRALDLGRRQLALEVLGLLTEDQRAAFRAMLAEGPDVPPGPPRRPR